jgi:hypothetical protein
MLFQMLCLLCRFSCQTRHRPLSSRPLARSTCMGMGRLPRPPMQPHRMRLLHLRHLPPAGPPSAQPASPSTGSAPATSPLVGPSSDDATSTAAPVIGHPMATRLRTDSHRAKQFTDGTVRYDPRRRAFFAAPVSHRDALREPAWHAAMTDEFVALHQNNTWRLVPGHRVSIWSAASGSSRQSITLMVPLTSIKLA